MYPGGVLVLSLLKTVSCDPSLRIIEGTTITPSPLEVSPSKMAKNKPKLINVPEVNTLMPIARFRGSPVPDKESDIISLAHCFRNISHISNHELKYAFCFSTYL